jgi:PAS domain S-box-containing protein
MPRDKQNPKSAAPVSHAATLALDSTETPEQSGRGNEAALKAFNHQITNILERISDGFMALDTNWRFTYLNRKGEEIFHRLQKKRSDLLGKVLWDEFPEFIGSEIEQNFRRAVADQVTVEFETLLAPLDAWFIVRAYPSADGISIYLLDISRRKRTEAERARTEAALRASEQHFRAAFNQAAVGMAVASLDGRFEEVNDRFSEILGISREQLITRTFVDITHPDDLAQTKDYVRRLVAGEIKGFTYEKRFLRGDGTIVWALASVTLLLDDAGKPDKFIGVVDDITLRKRAEERLRESAERLQLALIGGHLGDWSWDPKSDVITCGAEAAEILGLPPNSSITWHGLRQLLHEDDRERAREAVEIALAQRSDYDIEYRVRIPTGYRWVAAKGRGIYAQDGTVMGMIGVVLDISGQKSHEALGARLAAVVESSDDAIISLGFDTLITTWNKGAERMFGYRAEDIIGQSINRLLPPDRQDEEGLILGRIMKGERIEHYETIRLTKDGRPVDVSLTVSPVYDASNQLIGVSKISRDITERKKAEAELRRAQKQLENHAIELETQVAERTAKLRETIGELEAFSYSVSHDMRSPLRAMQGYSDALTEEYGGKLDDTARDYLNRIKRAASRMDLLIQDVLAYSRVAQGDVPLRAVDLESVVRDAIQNYPSLQPENARIIVHGPLPKVIGHEAYLTQAVSNILTNGVKFVARGTFPEIHIGAEREGEFVRVYFRDNGIGIAPEHRQHIFQIFGRVYSEKQYEGTGIGLAIAKKAAERMGGTIGVTSELGRGSCFYLLLKPAS